MTPHPEPLWVAELRVELLRREREQRVERAARAMYVAGLSPLRRIGARLALRYGREEQR